MNERKIVTSSHAGFRGCQEEMENKSLAIYFIVRNNIMCNDDDHRRDMCVELIHFTFLHDLRKQQKKSKITFSKNW